MALTTTTGRQDAGRAARGDLRSIGRLLRDIVDHLDGTSTAELAILSSLTATAAEINRAAAVSGRIVNATAATLAVDEATHEGKIVTLNRAGGIAVTLPAATGGGARYRFLIRTTFTSSATIKVTGNDIMQGYALMAQDGGATSVMFETAVDTDTITFSGTDTGGYIGTEIELIDMAADTWFVRVVGAATGSEVTPFSATV